MSIGLCSHPKPDHFPECQGEHDDGTYFILYQYVITFIRWEKEKLDERKSLWFTNTNFSSVDKSHAFERIVCEHHHTSKGSLLADDYNSWRSALGKYYC